MRHIKITYFESADNEKYGKELPPKQRSFGPGIYAGLELNKFKTVTRLFHGWSAILQFSLE